MTEESAEAIIGCGFLHKISDADLIRILKLTCNSQSSAESSYVLRPHLNDSGNTSCSLTKNGQTVCVPLSAEPFVGWEIVEQIFYDYASSKKPGYTPRLQDGLPYRLVYEKGVAFIMDKAKTIIIGKFDVEFADRNARNVINERVKEYMPAIHTINSLHKRFGEHIKMPAVTVKGNTVRYYDLAWFRSPDEKYPAIEVPATTGPLQDSPTLKLWDKLLPKLFNGSALKSRPDATLTNPEFFTLLPIFDIANIHALSPPVLEEAVASRTRDELVSYFERCNELCQLNVGVSPKSWNRFQPSPIISVDEKGEGFTVAHHKLDRKVAFTLKELAPVYEPLVSNAYGMDYFLVKS
eukprot:GHVT01085394.1.p1 GENE.GHVT01085394.1~~GHVT01085394.1.p1  ORF type:complete len:351 (-),score=26.51 GHVT01085394.1:504-1556(-)